MNLTSAPVAIEFVYDLSFYVSTGDGPQMQPMKPIRSGVESNCDEFPCVNGDRRKLKLMRILGSG